MRRAGEQRRAECDRCGKVKPIEELEEVALLAWWDVAHVCRECAEEYEPAKGCPGPIQVQAANAGKGRTEGAGAKQGEG